MIEVAKLTDAELIEEWERANEGGSDGEAAAVNEEVARRQRARVVTTTDAEVIAAWERACEQLDEPGMDAAFDEMERRGLDC